MNKKAALKYFEEMLMSRTSFCLNKLSTNKEIEKVNNAVNSIKQSFNAPTPTADEIVTKILKKCNGVMDGNDIKIEGCMNVVPMEYKKIEIYQRDNATIYKMKVFIEDLINRSDE